jgi:fructose 1,6-bisphosphate aldolase/phosphatase
MWFPNRLSTSQKKNLKNAKEEGLINSYHVFNAGDDLELLMVHNKGESNSAVHKLAFETFQEVANKALKLKLYGAEQDLLKTAFAGNICRLIYRHARRSSA